MIIYDNLKKRQKLNVKKTNVYKYNEENKDYISKVKNVYNIDSKSAFYNLVMCNILIKAFKNLYEYFDLIEEYKNKSFDINAMFEKFFKDHPCLIINGEKIYFPMFSKSLNYLLIHDYKKMYEYPYHDLKSHLKVSCINFFDEYGYSIFLSSFSTLELICEDVTSCAFYSEELETIFVINNQGTLDVAIHIFDKYLNIVNKDNLIFRIKMVMEYYFKNQKNQFIKALYDEHLISFKMYDILKRNVLIRFIKRAKKQEVKK